MFPSLNEDSNSFSSFLESHGLHSELVHLSVEALCDAVHRENANFDIDDMTLGIRNNAAFKALAEAGVEYGLFKHRPKGGKTYITNVDSTLKIMVHNTDEATGLGAHIPAFASKRRRRGTSYVHTEDQGELDFGDEVIEMEHGAGADPSTTIDLCIFADKVDGQITCRVEMLVDAQMNAQNTAFTGCRERYGMKFRTDELVATDASYDVEESEFDTLVVPKTKP
jgi:hypothetical protein